MPEASTLPIVELTLVAYLAIAAIQTTATIAMTATKLRRIWAVRARTVKYSDAIKGDLPGVSVLLPVFNEAEAAVRAAERLAELAHPRIEVIVINDGSTDGTLNHLRESLDLKEVQRLPPGPIATQEVRSTYSSRLWPSLLVVDKRSGGRADALNAGLNIAQHQLVCTVGCGSRLYQGSLLVAAHRFEEEPELAALSASLIPHVQRTLLGTMQLLMHARTVITRTCQSKLRSLTQVSEDFAVFQRAAAVALGGFKNDALASTDLAIRLHCQRPQPGNPYKVRFHADPAGTVEAPSTLREQLTRWAEAQRAAIRLLTVKRLLQFRPRRGRLSWITLPWLASEIVAPTLEATAAITLLALAAAGITMWSFLALATGTVLAFGTLKRLMLLWIVEAERPPQTPAGHPPLMVAALFTTLAFRPLEALAKAWGALAPSPRRTDAGPPNPQRL